MCCGMQRQYCMAFKMPNRSFLSILNYHLKSFLFTVALYQDLLQTLSQLRNFFDESMT